MEIRKAIKSDVDDLAYLINLAGEGIPEYLWGAMAGPGETALEVGVKRAAREEGGFSYRNARVCTADEVILGMQVSYCQPDPYEIGNLMDYPELVQPLVELESKVPGSWYLNAIATYEQYRGKGVGRRLMDDVEQQARSHGCTQISLIVASENQVAGELYQRLGYRPVESRAVVPYPGCLHGGEWVLMVKKLETLMD
ncbi:GNAT family N-acetyltransferase [Hahella ganghwensis]|uniref:GNAT family N-acetyltransferase n=1 Tax=Hahella ganghwensis TaxID=286420 RepID=UPI0003791CD9|nr:GNAT family N-acetyltransferase [Hahella ganghwensis]